jgi:transglutaminase-like putative cysteine protease
MKKSLHPMILPVLSLIILLNSCTTAKNTGSDTRVDTDRVKENNNSCFVQKNDGVILNFSSLKLVNTVFNDPYLLADSKTRIYPKEIKAYQDKDYYFVSQNGFINARKSYVSTEALPGFAVKLVSGKLNVYRKKFYNGTNAADEFYLQSGEQGQIVRYSPKIMKELLKDNTEAASYFNSRSKNISLSQRILSTAALVNNDRGVTKN